MRRILTIAEALNEALKEEMERDENVFVMGEDIGIMGGRDGVTRGLIQKFGERRILETPLNEEIFIGVAIGAAQVGLRPVIEFAHAGLLSIAATDIFRAGIWKWICGNRFELPIIIRAPYNEAVGPELSTSIISMFINLRGINIVAPSSPYQAKGLLKSAIRGNGPVIIFEHKNIYKKQGEVPDEDYVVPFGKGEWRRKGKDVSIVTYYGFNDLAETAAGQLAKEGIDAEILDLVNLKPLDAGTILETAGKTKKVLVVGSESDDCSSLFANIYKIVKEALPETKIRYLGAKNIPVPLGHFGPAVFPTAKDIIDNVKIFF